jgi:hypothetical protein
MPTKNPSPSSEEALMAPEAHPYTIVVGVSARSQSPTALRWAVENARTHQGRVVAIRAWRPTAPQTGSRVNPAPIAEDEPTSEKAARHALERDVAEVLGDAGGVPVEARLVVGGRRTALIQASSGADLLVVDAPRPSDLATSPLQLRRLVYGAHCPVVVMPPTISGEPPTWLERAGRAAGRSIVDAAGRAGRPGVRPPATH